MLYMYVHIRCSFGYVFFLYEQRKKYHLYLVDKLLVNFFIDNMCITVNLIWYSWNCCCWCHKVLMIILPYRICYNCWYFCFWFGWWINDSWWIKWIWVHYIINFQNSDLNLIFQTSVVWETQITHVAKTTQKKRETTEICYACSVKNTILTYRKIHHN